MKWPFVIYLLSIGMIAFAAGNFVGQRGVKVVYFKSSEPIQSIGINLVESDSYIIITPDQMPDGGKEWTWLLGPGDKRLENIKSIRVNDAVFEKDDISPVHSGFPALRYEVNIDFN